MKGIWIITRDIRLIDNLVLLEAHEKFSSIIPVFIINKQQIDEGNHNSLHFLFESLNSLNDKLISYGSCISFIYDYEFMDGSFCRYHNVTHGVINKAYTPFEKDRYHKYSQVLSLIEVEDSIGWKLSQLLKKDGTPYLVHTKFKNYLLQFPVQVPNMFLNFNFEPLQNKNNPLSWTSILTPKSPQSQWIGGDFEGERLISLITHRGAYLSPHLKFGTVSPRIVFYVAQSRNIDDIINGLTWRALYTSLHFSNSYIRKNHKSSKRLKYKWDQSNKKIIPKYH